MARFLRNRRGAGGAARREDAVFEFSRQLVGAAGVGEIAQALFRTIDDLFEVDRCVLLAIDEESERAHGVAAMGGMDAEVAAISIELAEDQSAVSRVVRDRVAHRVLDASSETLHNAQVARVVGATGSAVYVPLRTSGGVIGVVVVATSGRLRAFRRDEVDFVQKLANDAAVAIERARFAQQLRDVGERELIVASVARAVRESLDPDEVLRVAAREIGEQADADMVTIGMRWMDGLDGRTATWKSELRPADADVVPFDEASLGASARLAIEDRQPVSARASQDAPAGTEVSIPLRHRNDVLGVLVLDRPHHPFESTEVRLIELIAVEVAAAIEHVRLYQGSRRHLDEQLALARAAQSLTADLRFDRVLEHIVSEVSKLLRSESAAFYVYDREQSTLTLRAAFGEAERRAIGDQVGMKGLAGRVVQSGVSQLTNDYERDLGTDIHPVFRGVRRALAVPVRWQGDLRGVISVADRDNLRMITERDQSLLEAFADLASLALHNAEAYSIHSRQARIQAGFYRISQVLSSSLSRPATLASLAQAATEVLDGDWAIVVGGDGVDEDLHVEGSWLAPEVVVDGLREPSAFAESTATLAMELRRVVTSRSIVSDERLGPTWRALMGTAEVASQLAVPVQVHGRHSATVVVCFRGTVRFGDEELVVANNLATAATAALERAGLFENERRTRRLSEVLADVSALIAETLKAQTVLDRIVDQAAVLLEVDACSLAIAGETAARAAAIDRDTMVGDRPGEGGTTDAVVATSIAELRVHSAAGRDESLVAALLASPIGGLVEEVARSRRSVTVDEHASEGAAQSSAGERYEGFLGVPLRHPRGHLIGVLSAYSRRHRTWSDAEVASLESFASSAAIAIRNAELYDNIRRERERLRILLESIGEGIVATDAGGRVTIWNRAASELTGTPEEQAIGRQWRDVMGLATETVVEEGQAVVEARPGGAPMFLSFTSSRLQGKGDVPGGWIHAFRDVSATYTLDRLKSDFVSTVSYVLRTPLTSIYGFASTLLRDDLDFPEEDRRVFLEYISTETERLTGIVDDLLEVSSIDAGSVEVHVADVEVAPVLREAVDVARERGARRHISVHGQDGLQVRADPDKLGTVLTNLVGNAARFTPEGGEIRVDVGSEGDRVRIGIRDSGSGISPAEQKQLFTKFYVSPGANGIAGSGLGLYISKGLVDAMGGRIWVSSTLGEGSTFTVELPAVAAGANGG
ncbi:MAG: GAF domain-containing protein [Thermoleophilia bacterium]|nr:GAF domain-containing protein [Thermoleophilia bacterium]